MTRCSSAPLMNIRSVCTMFAGSIRKYRCRRHCGRQSATNFGTDMDDHLAISNSGNRNRRGKSFRLMRAGNREPSRRAYACKYVCVCARVRVPRCHPRLKDVNAIRSTGRSPRAHLFIPTKVAVPIALRPFNFYSSSLSETFELRLG